MDIEALRKLLSNGRDNAMLRFTLGKTLFDAGDYQESELHLTKALEFDPDYSAAWQWLGQTLLLAGRLPEALSTLEKGLAVASSGGDIQTRKVMEVLRRRALKAIRAQEEE